MNIYSVLARLLTALIPFKMARKRIRTSLLVLSRNAYIRKKRPSIRKRQAEILENIRNKKAAGQPIRAAFLVCDVSMFTAEPVYKKLRDDPGFDCFIAVVPRLTRGNEFLKETLDKTYTTLAERYGDRVRLFYEADSSQAEPLEGQADVVFSSILYEDQTCDIYTVERISAYALVALFSYGYSGLFTTNAKRTIFLPNVVFSWKFFVSNRDILDLWTKLNPLLLENATLGGYVKMDRLAEFPPSAEQERKKVIIAPHHTLAKETDGLSLSNFLALADFFLDLPVRYPQIDFIFRPHPFLFPRLATTDWWGEEKTAAYRAKMTSHPNVEFQQGGDYFQTFAESSALIHDCGSFLAEYFYTGKPQCYLVGPTTEKLLLPFARKLLEHAYRADCQRHILDFIDDVVINGRDHMKSVRDQFAKSSVCIFHPRATEEITEIISHELTPLSKEREYGKGVPS